MLQTESHRTPALSETYPYHHLKQEAKRQTFKVIQTSTRIVQKTGACDNWARERPVEISCGGVVIQRRDIATTLIEADNIIVQQDIKL